MKRAAEIRSTAWREAGSLRPFRAPHGVGVLLLSLLVLLMVRCDTVEPVSAGRLVVEGFITAGQPLPALTLRHTQPLGAAEGEAAAVVDADVMLYLDGQAVAYAPVPAVPGRYAPAGAPPVDQVPERSTFALEIGWQGQQVRAVGTVPPRVRIDRIELDVPEAPVEAVLLDSLRLDTLATGTREGFIYPVEVSVSWTTDFEEAGADSAYWIRPQIRPYTSFQSATEEFFVREDQVLRERAVPREAGSQRRWTGVYAVAVDAPDAPLPEHQLRVALLRSGADYARFAASRDAPERREPVSNVEGALGIVAGISVDSVLVQVGR